MNTQSQRLLKHLQSGMTVTRVTALTDLGIFELSARVIDLERLGYIVNRRRITVENRFSEKVSVSEYWMDVQNTEKAAA